jgi:hypothetical protein
MTTVPWGATVLAVANQNSRFLLIQTAAPSRSEVWLLRVHCSRTVVWDADATETIANPELS